MKTAVLLKEFNTMTGMGMQAMQKLYRLTPSLAGNKYVLVSAAYTWDHGNETYIFGANSKGNVTNWNELKGSYKGGLDHTEALNRAGYVIKEIMAKKTKLSKRLKRL